MERGSGSIEERVDQQFLERHVCWLAQVALPTIHNATFASPNKFNVLQIIEIEFSINLTIFLKTINHD